MPTLDVLAQRADTHPLVVDRRFEPDSLSPRALEIRFDVRQYPETVSEARLDVRWFEGGNYSFHYVESFADGTWQCRWDHHPKPNAPAAHFHPPPDAAERPEPSPIEDQHHVAVLFDVLEQVERRIQELYEQ